MYKYYLISYIHYLILGDLHKPAITHSRKLLSTVEWEKCDYEIGYARNYSEPPSKWRTPSVAYLWIILYIFLTFTVFVGKSRLKN